MKVKTKEFLKELNQKVRTQLKINQLSYFFDEITCDLDEIDLSRSEKEILKDLCVHWDGAPFYFNGSDEDAAEIFQNESEEITSIILETIAQIKRRML